jgi:membrane associated rhomboid family serine protease
MSRLAAEELDSPRLTPAVQALLALSIAVAFVQATLVTPDDMATWLGFQQAHWRDAWWTIGTYSVVHAGAWSLLANMFALVVFGPRVEQAWGTRAFVALWLWCAAGGAAAHALLGHDGALVGSSAAVFGVMFAYTWSWSRDELYVFGVVPVRAWTLATLVTASILSLGLYDARTDGTSVVAHLAGFLFAFVYLKRPNAGSIEQFRQRVSPAPDPTDETPRAIPRAMPRSHRGDEVDEIVAQSKAAIARRSTPVAPPAAPSGARPEELNRVLDKISEHGLDSLTSDERLLLEEMSRRLRNE